MGNDPFDKTGRTRIVGDTVAPPEALDTLPKLLGWNATHRAGAPACREKLYGIWQSSTWAEVAAEVRAFALGMKALGLAAGDRVAIIGSNRPRLYWTVPAALHANHVVGIDINEEVLAIARSKPFPKENVDFVCADLYAETVPGGPFDAALVAHWWSHIDRREQRGHVGRIVLTVAVEGHHHRVAAPQAQLDAGLDRPAVAEVDRQPHRLAAQRARDPAGVVAGAVVDHHHVVPGALLPELAEHLGKVGRLLSRGDHDQHLLA